MTTPEPDDWRNADTAALVDAFLRLETPAQAERFLRDLCTRRELEEMSRRWAVVRALHEGHSYRTAADQIGVSTATVTRISQWLRHGTGGYREALDRMAGET